METQILKNLIEKYNIKDSDIFARIVKRFLLGEIKPEDLGYQFQVNLNIDLTSAVELGVTIQFLSNEEKRQALAELSNYIKETVDIDTDIKTLIYRNNVILDANLNARLIKLITSYLQDIRNEFDFKDALTRSPKIAGIGLDTATADNLISQLKTKKEEWQKKGINLKTYASNGGQIQEENIDVSAKIPAPKFTLPQADSDEVTIDQILEQRARVTGKPTQMPQAPSPVKILHDVPFVREIETEELLLDSTDELPQSKDSAKQIAPQPDFVQKPEPPRIVPPPIRPPENKQPLRRTADIVSNRPQVADVKFEPKMYGPLDELAALSLSDFRRLSKDPWQAIQKISGKLDILEVESIVRKNEGIKALKSSPLYNVYSDIMNRALIEGKTFEQVIAERGDINITEFKAIMELNKSLKY